MTPVDFYFDPISPYAFLAFERLPAALIGHSVMVRYRPVLFAAFLKQHGQKGPAEIEPKRQWTTRETAWKAHRHGHELTWPAQHPFNPLALLRLLYATAPAGGLPNRRAVEAVVRHVWHGGADAADPQRLQALTAQLQAPRAPDSAEVKAELRQATDAAIARGVFGVPTVAIGERLFWGADALDMVAACLAGDPWFDDARWNALGAPRPGIERR